MRGQRSEGARERGDKRSRGRKRTNLLISQHANTPTIKKSHVNNDATPRFDKQARFRPKQSGVPSFV